MTMDYQLARSLKDAGFPQEKSLFVVCKRMPESQIFKDAFLDIRTGDEFIASPTLTELIEACGKKIYGYNLEIETNNAYWFRLCALDENEAGEQWIAEFVNIDGYAKEQGIGSTPEEAAANLYIALNKK